MYSLNDLIKSKQTRNDIKIADAEYNAPTQTSAFSLPSAISNDLHIPLDRLK